MPSKLTGILASERPVVATAAAGTLVASVVESCGIVTEPENAEDFADAIVALLDSAERRIRLGRAARAYAVRNLVREQGLARFERQLLNCTAQTGAG